MEIKRYVDFCGEGGGTAEASYGERGQYVGAPDFDRILAERDALQQRLNAVEEENDRLRHALNFQKARKAAPLAVPAADCEDCCDTGLGPCMRCANKESRS